MADRLAKAGYAGAAWCWLLHPGIGVGEREWFRG